MVAGASDLLLLLPNKSHPYLCIELKTDNHNMELLDVLKAYDETGKLTLAELRKRVEQHNIELL